MTNLSPRPKKAKQNRKKKRNALIICSNQSQFWTTQNQFWQWVRELKVKKLSDNPLTGKMILPYEEMLIEINKTILNLAHKNHINEVLFSRRFMRSR